MVTSSGLLLRQGTPEGRDLAPVLTHALGSRALSLSLSFVAPMPTFICVIGHDEAAEGFYERVRPRRGDAAFGGCPEGDRGDRARRPKFRQRMLERFAPDQKGGCLW